MALHHLQLVRQPLQQGRPRAFGGGDTNTGTFENNTDLQGRTYTAGLYAVDTLSINEQWHVTGGLRYNYQEVDNKDRRADQSEGSLTEKQSWARINPTIGVTFAPSERYQTYASYSESNRAPTSIELGCSNPLIACQLPTQMADDPPLDDVVSKTYEVGARGQLTETLSWNSAIYHAMNHDDLMFINTNALNGLGYFDNVGRTQRDGLDVGLSGSMANLFNADIANKFSFATSYSYVNATYDSDFQLSSDANSSRQISSTSYTAFDNPEAGVVTKIGVLEGNPGLDEDDVEENYALENNFIQVKAGDRLANIPQHRFKFRLNYEHTENLRLGVTTLAYGKAYLMGNENNKHQGDGETPGYILLNADMNWTPAKNWLVSLKAVNLLDKNYYSGGRLLMNGFNPGSGIGARDEAFRGPGLLPGSPQAAWVTLSYDFK
ncbi:MAG: TonB-dependent receptor domain-containing protein [Methylophilaceae bacterium]